jgi:hypothetical protein
VSPVLPWQIGDRARLRKPHPCGGDLWRVVRTGADMGLVCEQCGRRVMLPRDQFDRQLKERLAAASVPLGFRNETADERR